MWTTDLWRRGLGEGRRDPEASRPETRTAPPCRGNTARGLQSWPQSQAAPRLLQSNRLLPWETGAPSAF